MNRIGDKIALSTFGESHGVAMGGVLDGMPSGVRIDMEAVQGMIDRRRTGRSVLTSQRKESDIPEILSGISAEGVTLGTPIGFIFRNSDARSKDYSDLKNHYRPNHADYCYDKKYGVRDARGGGRSSARETVNWVMGGALIMEWLKTLGIEIEAKVTQVGKAGYDDPFIQVRETPQHPYFQEDGDIEKKMLEEVEDARKECDSVGGRVSCIIRGVPVGLGEPVFGKLQAKLGEAMMSLNAAKGFEYGMGMVAASMRGSDSLDLFNPGFTPLPMQTDRNGGILGGISNGMPIYFSVYLKPTPTISRELPMPDADGNIDMLRVEGRHDPCVALRAPVIVEALAAITIANFIR